METNTNPGQNPAPGEQQQSPRQPAVQPSQPSPQTSQPGIDQPKMSFLKENKWAVYTIIGSLVVLAIGGYLVLRKPSQSGTVQPKINISIDAPQNAPSGSEIVYHITIADNDNASAKNTTVDLVYPQGFTFEDSTPKPTKLSGTEFSLPAIDPGQNATIMVKGTIQGNADEIKTISALMHYNFGNFSATYVAQTQAQTQIKTADVVLQLDGQATASNFQDLTYTISYANNTQNQVTNFQIALSAPKAFHIKSEDPQPISGQTFSFGALNPNQSGKITIVGDFENTSPGDQQVFSAQASGSSGSGQTFVLSSAQLPVQIQGQPLEADINYSGDPSAKPGADLNFEIDYQNNSNKIINGASVSVTLDGPFDLDNLNLRTGVINGNVITWDASQLPALKTLAVGATGKINFNVQVKDPATRSGQKNMVLKATPTMQSSEFQQPFTGKNVSIKVQTVEQLNASVAFAGGTNPPQVGQSTVYSAEIDLRNTSNDVTNAKVVLNIPNGNNFDLATVNSAEQNNISYDKNTKQLTWNVGTLAANAGSFSPLRKLLFSVTIVPQSSSRHRNVPLITNIQATGTDNFANVPINLNFRDLSTGDDPSGNGTVQ